MSASKDILRRIGQGFCGTVWSSLLDSIRAIKREDGGPGRSLYNDYIMHQYIVQKLPSQARVPFCHEYIQDDNQTWWSEHIAEFPDEFQMACNALITERIPPLSKIARDFLTDKYCPGPLVSAIKSSMPNGDCLVRPYLGRRRRLEKQSRMKAFNLRNYPLHADQIEELGLDGSMYARIMAKTLAELHWTTHVDANDIEFVIASPRMNHTERPGVKVHTQKVFKSNVLGDHSIWILDFDCCRQISLDEAGVKQAVRAFYKNDPFYPRPGRNNHSDQMLWNDFAEQFLQSSIAILGKEGPLAHLPTLWLDLVEKHKPYRCAC